MRTIGIKIDLSVFFCDERKLVMILLDNNWKTVECLQKRIQQLYEVPNILLVNNDGCLLHPKESIDIIRLCSNLKAIKPSENTCSIVGPHKFNKNKSKSAGREGRVDNNDEATIILGGGHENTTPSNLLIDKDKSKRKLPWIENAFHTSTPNSAHNSDQFKRTKGSKNAGVQINLLKKQSKQASNEITSTSEVSEQTGIQQTISGVEGADHQNETNSSAEHHMKKKKRTNPEHVQQNADVSVNVKKPKICNLTPLGDLTKSSKGTKATQHIYFREDGTATEEVIASNDTGAIEIKMVTPTTHSTSTAARFCCFLEGDLNQGKARKFKYKPKKVTNTLHVNAIEIKNIAIIPSVKRKVTEHINDCPEVQKLIPKEEKEQSNDDLICADLEGRDSAITKNTDCTENDANKNSSALAMDYDEMETYKDRIAEATTPENSKQGSAMNIANENENNKSDDITSTDVKNLENNDAPSQIVSTNASCDETKSTSTSSTKTTKDVGEIKSLLEMVKEKINFSAGVAKVNECSVVSIDDDSDVGEISEIIDLNESDDGL